MLIYQRSQSNWSLDTSNSALEETRELLREGENCSGRERQCTNTLNATDWLPLAELAIKTVENLSVK